MHAYQYFNEYIGGPATLWICAIALPITIDPIRDDQSIYLGLPVAVLLLIVLLALSWFFHNSCIKSKRYFLAVYSSWLPAIYGVSMFIYNVWS